MDFRIKETGEVKTLSYVDCNTGIDGINDLIGNSGAIGDYITSDEDGVYLIAADDYEWWVDYIHDAESDDQEISDLRKGYNNDDIQKIMEDEWYGAWNDYNDHHDIWQRVIGRVKAEARRI